MDIFKFKSPIYDNVIPIPIEQLAPQELNPNHTNNRQISAIQISILNSGFTSPVLAKVNSEFDGVLRDKEKMLEVLFEKEELKSGFNEYEFTRQLKNNREKFPYIILDGSQRTGLMRLGLYHWLKEDENIRIRRDKSWKSGKRPERPGIILLEYLAWRENFCIPVLLIDGDESVTVLHDAARGSFQLNQVEQMVIELNDMGWDKNRISRELFIDSQTVNKLLEKESFTKKYTLNDSKVLENKRWEPEKDKLFEEIRQKYIKREIKDLNKEE